MNIGRTEKFSITLSVLFHALVLAGLALGLGGTSAGPASEYMAVELFEAPGAASTAPRGTTVHTPGSTARPVAHHEVPAPPVHEAVPPAVTMMTKSEPAVQEQSAEVATEEQTEMVEHVSEAMIPDTFAGHPGESSVGLASTAETTESADAVVSSTGEGGSNGKRDFHLEEVRTIIQAAVAYPLIARRRGLEASVLAGFFIDDKGVPHNVRILQSSGFSFFDREVIRAINASSPYPLAGMALEVPVVFQLRDLASR